MSLGASVKQFLDEVRDPTSLTTTRDHLATAVELLKQVDADQFVDANKMIEPKFKPGDRVRLNSFGFYWPGTVVSEELARPMTEQWQPEWIGVHLDGDHETKIHICDQDQLEPLLGAPRKPEDRL